MTQTEIISGPDLETVVKTVRRIMFDLFPEEKVEVKNDKSKKPLVKAGTNEVVLEELDNGSIKITATERDNLFTNVSNRLAAAKHAPSLGSMSSKVIDVEELFDVIEHKKRPAIVRTGEAVAGVLLEAAVNIEDAKRRVLLEFGVDPEGLLVASRTSEDSDITMSREVIDSVKPEFIIAAGDSTSTIQKVLDLPEGFFAGARDVSSEAIGSRSNRDVVVKPFSKDDADYRSKSHPEFDPSHERCRTCAHYDGHGNCLIVPDIDPDEYCKRFYSDFGVFGHEHPDFMELNLAIFGDDFDWDTEDAEEFLDKVADKLSERVNG